MYVPCTEKKYIKKNLNIFSLNRSALKKQKKNIWKMFFFNLFLVVCSKNILFSCRFWLMSLLDEKKICSRLLLKIRIYGPIH